MNRIFLLFGLTLLAFTGLNAQAPDAFCATHQTEADLAWLRQFQADPAAYPSLRGDGLTQIPVKVHLVGTDDGNGYYRLSLLMASFCDLNERFEPTGFHFYIAGDINYLDNDNWYAHDFFQGGNMMAANNVEGAVNMYFVNDAAGACGYFSPFRDAVAIAKSCASLNGTTITHELGHFFSLPHTFYGWEDGTPPLSQQERVNGTNCTTAADGFCDTPPDYAPYRWTCPTTGPFTDPNGETFTPDGSLYMSYSNDACTERFSENQQAAMRANVTFIRPELLLPTPPALVDLEAVTAVQPADGELNTPYNYSLLSWTKEPNATAYQVTIALNASMTAIVQEAIVSDTLYIPEELAKLRKHYWQVKPITPANTCTPYSAVRTFTTGEVFSGISSHSSTAQPIRTWPNPLGSGQVLQWSFTAELATPATARLLDLNGRVVALRNVAVLGGNNRFSWSLPSLTAGMYVLEVTGTDASANARWRTKIALTR